MSVETDHPSRLPEPVIGLNEFFIGPQFANTTLVYKLKPGNEPWTARLKSSGLIVYTGTGSTGWAQSINNIPREQIRNIWAEVQGYFGISNEKVASLYEKNSGCLEEEYKQEAMIRKLQENLRNRKVFFCQDDQLKFMHRELFIGGADWLKI